jgi:hypothetical protein
MRVPTNTGIPTRKPQLRRGYGISSGGVARIFEGVGGTGGSPAGRIRRYPFGNLW